jgi:hypothetical protein
LTRIWIGVLRRDLSGHAVESVPLIGWAGLTNGELLARAEIRFDVFITMDSNLAYQRNLADHKIAVIVLEAPSNRLADTLPLMSKVLASLTSIKPGTLLTVSS